MFASVQVYGSDIDRKDTALCDIGGQGNARLASPFIQRLELSIHSEYVLVRQHLRSVQWRQKN